jgi:dUTP pyrophosphatase
MLRMIRELLELPEPKTFVKTAEAVNFIKAAVARLDKTYEAVFKDINSQHKRLTALEAELAKWTKIKVQIWKKDPTAFDLEKNKDWDACYDVRAVADLTILSGERGCVDTGLVIAVPSHCEVQVRPRSGISANLAKPRQEGTAWEEEFPKHLTIHLGTCDAGYRNTYKVIVENDNDDDIIIRRGDKIAQLAVRTKPDTEEEYVDALDKLPPDDGRGTNGFSSSGV